MSIQYFSELKKAFFELKLAKLADRLHDEDPKQGFKVVRTKAFLFSPDLEELENDIRLYLLYRIKEIRAEKRRHELAAEQTKLRGAHDELDSELLLAARQTGEERRIKRTLRRDLSLSKKRLLLLDLTRFAVFGSRSLADSKEDAKLQKMVDYLVDISGSHLCAEAQRLHALAREEPDARKREQFLRKAIEAQRHANRKVVGVKEVPEVPAATAVAEPVDQPPLWDYARQVFVIEDLLPSGVDEGMAKAILLTLVGPGTKARRFQAKYWPEESLRREVVRYYRRLQGASYEPAVFGRTLRWLHSQGVLFSKKKPDERMYSLSSKPSNGRSPNAQEIIRRVIRTVEAFKSEHST